MVRSASRHPTWRGEALPVPLTSLATTMLRPLNSAIALTTVRMSAPSTSMLNVPEPVDTRPTRLIALVSWATAGEAASVASHAPASFGSPARTLPVRIRLISLPRQWNRHRLRLTIRGQLHDDGIPLELPHATVHHLVAPAQHHTVAAGVLDHRDAGLGPDRQSTPLNSSHQ